MFTSGRRQPTFAEMAHVTSGSLTAPESTVRTVQQTAVLEHLSGYVRLTWRESNLHDAQSHQDTQCNLDPQLDL